MKKLILLLIFMFSVSIAQAGDVDSIYPKDILYGVDGWSVFAEDDDIDVAWELVTGLDTTYAQLDAPCTIEVNMHASGVTNDVTITGIDDDGNQVSELIRATSVAVTICSNATFRYVDQASATPESSGAIDIIKGTGNTFITSIPAGELSTSMAQHFAGEKTTYITGWGGSIKPITNRAVGSATKDVVIALRYYPSDSDCLDEADGYHILDMMYLSNDFLSNFRAFPQPIKCSNDAWVAVFASADTADSCVNILLQGYDR